MTLTVSKTQERTAAIRDREAAASPGPWRWRGHDDGDVELRSPVDMGRRIITTMRADPCIVSAGSSWDDYFLSLTPGACDPCRAYFAKSDLSERRVPCAKPENLDTVWLADAEAGFVRPANHWAVREVPYRADIVGVEHPDARFIAHARDDVTFLLTLVDRYEEALSAIAGSADNDLSTYARFAEVTASDALRTGAGV